MNECTAVLMAGGNSSRMGRDKAWLDYQGRPLWQVQLEKLRPFATEILISARVETFAATETGCQIIFDEGPRRGPLGGLHVALKAAKFNRIVLLGIDMPGMTSAYLASLVEESSSEFGIIPECRGYYQGLAAVYPRKIEPLLDAILVGSDYSFQNLSRQAIAGGILKARPVKTEEEDLFQNWNSPTDLP